MKHLPPMWQVVLVVTIIAGVADAITTSRYMPKVRPSRSIPRPSLSRGSDEGNVDFLGGVHPIKSTSSSVPMHNEEHPFPETPDELLHIKGQQFEQFAKSQSLAATGRGKQGASKTDSDVDDDDDNDKGLLEDLNRGEIRLKVGTDGRTEQLRGHAYSESLSHDDAPTTGSKASEADKHRRRFRPGTKHRRPPPIVVDRSDPTAAAFFDEASADIACETIAAEKCRGLMYSYAEFVACTIRNAATIFGPRNPTDGSRPHVCYALFVDAMKPCAHEMIKHCPLRDSGSAIKCFSDREKVAPLLSSHCRSSLFYRTIEYSADDDIDADATEEEKERRKEFEAMRAARLARVLDERRRAQQPPPEHQQKAPRLDADEDTWTSSDL